MSEGVAEVVLVARNLHKVYRSGFEDLHVLKNLTLEVRKGESMAIVGASGTGKSTLLHLLGGLDRPTKGEIFLEGIRLADFSESELARVRNQRFGFVFQFHYLLPEFSALENVRMPAFIGGTKTEQATLRAEMLLEQVGLKERKFHKPAELSGGSNNEQR